jgi:rod shape-determining protein MreD
VSGRHRSHLWLFLASAAMAYLLQLLPLPQTLEAFKPYWLALVLLYWALEEPERVGLGRAFLLGLVGDVLHGEILGEQALRLTILAFIVLRFRARLRFFPMWQQALAALALLLNDRIVLLMARSFAGDPVPPPSFWLSPLTGMLVWPWLFLLLDDLRARLRIHEA